ncbi:hypothetical protein GCM10010965_11090 [Caldalkalibacillus thermarum]|nr:hypothetical protein GCM10010965_11090 [Caldalkalibacillus thermarum]
MINPEGLVEQEKEQSLLVFDNVCFSYPSQDALMRRQFNLPKIWKDGRMAAGRWLDRGDSSR